MWYPPYNHLQARQFHPSVQEVQVAPALDRSLPEETHSEFSCVTFVFATVVPVIDDLMHYILFFEFWQKKLNIFKLKTAARRYY